MRYVFRMNSTIYAIWTILAVISALPMLAMVVGGAAWNGINVAVAVYLLMSVGGVLGLLAGFPATFGAKKNLCSDHRCERIVYRSVSSDLRCGFHLEL